MRTSRRRESVDEIMERLRLASPECSGLGLEEEEKSQVEQTLSATAPKEYCEKCNISFGLAEKRVAVSLGKVMHEDCYAKHLHSLSEAANRIHSFTQAFRRIVH